MQQQVNSNYPTKPVHFDFISPGPINLVKKKLLNKYHPWITATSRAIPAPDHLHKIHTLPPELKKYTLPIMPNTDFMYALQAGGPPEHKYEREFKDLKFIASKSVSSPGILTPDPDIQAPEQLDGKASLWPKFSGGRPMSLARMSRYPGLTQDMVHPAVLNYYKEKGIHVGREAILDGLV